MSGKTENIKATGRPFHSQRDALDFAVSFIREHQAVSESTLEISYDEYLRGVHKFDNYDETFEADLEMVCSDTKERRNKNMQNLSNHGIFEMDYDIVTINIREANRLGYKTPGGLKFSEKWYMTRRRAEQSGYPVHDTVAWDNNIKRLLKSI